MVLLAFGKGESLQVEEHEEDDNYIYDAEKVPVSFQFPGGGHLDQLVRLTDYLNGLKEVSKLDELKGDNIPLCRIVGTESSELYNPAILLEEKVLFL